MSMSVWYMYACYSFMKGPFHFSFQIGWLSFNTTCQVVWDCGGRCKIFVLQCYYTHISPLLWCWHAKCKGGYARFDFFFSAMDGVERRSLQAPWSATSSGGDAKPNIDPALRNQWLLHYIIIDGARKCHRQSATTICYAGLSLLLVSGCCVSLVCSHSMLVYITCS